MCAIPQLCSRPAFNLRGPITQPPLSGWRLQTLPSEASHLQSAWDVHPSSPDNSKAAWWDAVTFMQANGLYSSPLIEKVVNAGIQQWCSPDPARCRGLFTPDKTPFLPWAKQAWEDANNSLHDGAVYPRLILLRLVVVLTSRIAGPDGCPACALHWAQVLKANPVPKTLTLDEARHWLVDRHNDTREGKTPTPYDEVAAKFNWTPA